MTREDIVQEIQRLLRDEVGKSHMSESAYDIGWLVRLVDKERRDHPRYPKLFERLQSIQHADGSWGSQIPFAHDRVISTLSVIAGVSTWSLNETWKERIHNGLRAIESFAPKLLNESEATVAFELLFPKLLDEIKQQGYAVNIPSSILARYDKLYKEKLTKLPLNTAMNRPSTLLHALEALDDDIDVHPFAKFQSSNGSFGLSPAATASMLLKGVGGKKAEEYLDLFTQSSKIPFLWPIDIFEINWCLFPLFFLNLNNQFQDLINPLVSYLQKFWTSGGVGLSKDFSVPDIDDTSTAFYLIQCSGQKLDIRAFEYFETADGFMCYSGERSGSASHYADLLFALSTCERDSRVDRMKRKILDFLFSTQHHDGHWDDKWNISPYYATSRIILALVHEKEATSFVDRAMRYIIETQHKNGLWGFGSGTIEESAYALVALFYYSKSRVMAEKEILQIQTGFEAIMRNMDKQNYPGLWIGKSLYTPSVIVRLTILSTIFAFLEYDESTKITIKNTEGV